MKNTFFLSILFFVMTFNFACSQKGIDATAFQNSLEAFNIGKKLHQNSYQFTIKFASFTGYWQHTTFVVKNGKVTERHFESGHEYNEKAHTIWKEIGPKVGSNKEEGHKVITMEDVYAEAKGWTSGSNDNNYFFETDTAGILSTAGFVPNGCMDDCFEGYHVSDFKWL